MGRLYYASTAFCYPPCKAHTRSARQLRDESIVCLVRLKATREVHLINLFTLKDTAKRLCGYTVHESRYDPVNCKGIASSVSEGFLEFEGIGLKMGCTLFPGLSSLLSSGDGVPRGRSGWEGRVGPGRMGPADSQFEHMSRVGIHEIDNAHWYHRLIAIWE